MTKRSYLATGSVVEESVCPAAQPDGVVFARGRRGVAQGRPELIECVRRQLLESLNGYLKLDELTGGIDGYAVAPGLGSLAGPLGALALAADTI